MPAVRLEKNESFFFNSGVLKYPLYLAQKLKDFFQLLSVATRFSI